METTPAKLEKLMASCQHDIWGFVIYRSAYGPDSDTDFFALIRHLKDLVAECDEDYGNQPIFQRLTWTMFDDRNTLENATNAQIKKTFSEWCCSDSAISEQPNWLHPVSQSPLARYQFCLHIDQASLDSFSTATSKSSASKSLATAFVNIVARRFPQDISEEYLDDPGDDADDEFEDDGLYSPIEGNHEPDVGWCKLPIDQIYLGAYVELCHNETWFRLYVRPPALVGSRHGLSYDGF